MDKKPFWEPRMIWRAVVIDVVLCVLMLSLSVMSDEQFWRVFYASGSLLAIIDAIWASRVLDAVEEAQD